MPRILRAPAFAGALLAVLFATSPAHADSAAPAPKDAKAMDDAMTAEMMKFANPGPEHAKFKPMVGTFDAVVKQWVGGPEPVVSKGVMQNAMVLGGRYMESRYKGTYQGQPFEGWGMTGYDLRNKRLVAMWMDTMTTEPMIQTGTLSDDGKTMTGTGTVPGPGGQTIPVRTVTTIESPNKHVYSMFGTIEGKEMPFMEITYTRK